MVGPLWADERYVCKDVTHLLLAQSALAGLIGGTIEYSEIIQRRARARRVEVDRRAAEASGLVGMVRSFLTDR